LVEVVCFLFDGAAAAAWMRLVVEAIREKSLMHIESTRQLGAVAFTDQQQPVLMEPRSLVSRSRGWQVDQSGCCPILQSRISMGIKKILCYCLTVIAIKSVH